MVEPLAFLYSEDGKLHRGRPIVRLGVMNWDPGALTRITLTLLECDYGEGDQAKFYPVLAGQHYKYMLRQITDIRDGRRRNANPEMVEVVKKYTDEDLSAVVDYMSRLEWPERQKTAE